MLLNQNTISALLATGIISIAPNLLLFLFPSFGDVHESKNSHGRTILSLGQAISAGGLLGDVFLHSLPHAMEELAHEVKPEDHEHEIEMGMLILAGFISFLVLDGVIRVFDGKHSHSNSDSHFENGSHMSEKARNGSRNGVHTYNGAHTHNCADFQTNHVEAEKVRNTEKSSEVSKQVQQKRLFTSTVILNLAADALHNFTDGLAIGASFSISSGSNDNSSYLSMLQSQGGIASLSVLFHEIPHELGDYSILIGSGFSKSEAIASQFFTAIAAFLGTIFGLVASHSFDSGHGAHDHNHNILSFTSGGFIYLAACGILPDLLNQPCSTKVRGLQLCAFCFGIAFMYFVAILEHNHENEQNNIVRSMQHNEL